MNDMKTLTKILRKVILAIFAYGSLLEVLAGEAELIDFAILVGGALDIAIFLIEKAYKNK